MAKQFNEGSGAELGYEVKVHNLDRHQAANRSYIAVHHVAEETGDIVSYLFTELEIKKAVARARHQVEDVPQYRRSLLKRLFFIK